MLNATDCTRIVPSNMIDVKRIRAATHGSTVLRSCILLHYEHKDLQLQELTRLALPGGDAVADSLKSHLVSKEDTPQDSFVGDTIVCIPEPRHIDDTGTSSPIVVGYVVAGDTESELFAGSVVTTAHLAGHWRVLTLRLG